MDTIVLPVKELSTVQYRACKTANYGPGGGWMSDMISEIRTERDLDGTAIMLWEGSPDKVSSLYAWAMLIPVNSKLVDLSRYAKSKSKYAAQFWVKSQHRRKGYGNLLMQEVQKFDPKPVCFPHHDVSAEFFKNHNYVTTKDFIEWRKKK